MRLIAPAIILLRLRLGREFVPYASFHGSRDHSAVDGRSGNRANFASAVGRAGRQRHARLERLSRSERRAQEGEATRRIPCSQPNGQLIL
jgi:hypothetical protein